MRAGTPPSPLPSRERVAPKAPGEGRARIKALILGGTLTLPPLRGGSLPLPGRERGLRAGRLFAGVLALTAALLAGPAAAQVAAASDGGPALFQCGRYLRNGETLYGIPPGILHAMSIVESGRAGMPWPWALNVSGRPHYPATRREALRLMQDGEGGLRGDVAVGCMQIHTRWHAGSFAGGEDMLDPAVNVAYAARFLRELFDRHGSWTEAVRRYHASDPAAQNTYLCLVLDRRVQLGYQRETAEMRRLCSGPAS